MSKLWKGVIFKTMILTIIATIATVEIFFGGSWGDAWQFISGQPRISITRPDVPFYEKFRKIFAKRLEESPNSILNSEAPMEKAKLIKRCKKSIVEILTAINYKIIFEGYDSSEPIVTDPSVVADDPEQDIKNILDSDDAISACKMSYSDVQKLKTVDLSGFMLNTITEAFAIFENTKEVILNNTGLTNCIEELRCMPSLESIQARNNLLTFVPYLDDFKCLRTIDISNNNIVRAGGSEIDHRNIRIIL